MTTELRVHPSFFREFAAKTWVSPNEIVKELVENAFDEDATLVLVTVLRDGSIAVEDNAGMDERGMEKFLVLGSPHKRDERISPRLRRVRTGRYGTGRLSFLTSFESMKIKTKRDEFEKSIVIDGGSLEKLFSGYAKLEEVREPSVRRNGSELVLKGSKTVIDTFRLIKEIRKLAILRQPMFKVYIKEADVFREWNFEGAQQIMAPDIQGHRIVLNIEDGRITGEITIARRPLSEDEKGIAIMVGNHVVTRTNFGFDTRLSRVTGYARCDTLTSRFADKSAIIEDQEYVKFNQAMKKFITETILPSLSVYEDVLITREESKIYREIDKVLGQAIVETLETKEEVEGYEVIDFTETGHLDKRLPPSKAAVDLSSQKKKADFIIPEEQGLGEDGTLQPRELADVPGTPLHEIQQPDFQIESSQLNEQTKENFQKYGQSAVPSLITKKITRPIVKRTFALKKVGYKVIPYEDESDSRYSFKSESVVFVNKANSTYKAEAARGEEFLLRHIISIVAEALAETKHPEGKDALELQNRLVAEAIRIHDRSATRK
jgi:hypothetical protein